MLTYFYAVVPTYADCHYNAAVRIIRRHGKTTDMKAKTIASGENNSNTGPRTHIFFLSKFFDNANHAADFMNGRLYANKLSYFQDLEEPDRATRGDPHEGIVAWGQPGVIKIEINGHDLSNDLAAPASLSSNRLGAFNVICMHAGYLTDFGTPLIEDLHQIRKRLSIPEECRKFGDIAVVIKNGPEFLNRVKVAAQRHHYREAHGLVEYYDPLTFNGFFLGISGAFRKQEKFRPEREYRIALETGSVGTGPIILNIGHIGDIAMYSTIDEINRTMRIEQTT